MKRNVENDMIKMIAKDEKRKEKHMSLYSVVVPVYNSEHTLGELYTRLEKVFRETLKEDFELILVDDGSKDRSYEIMTELREKDHRVRIIQMACNFDSIRHFCVDLHM